MQTIKTISNISYNTPQFFKSKIKDLERRGIIDWCYWIEHKADVDELKDHIHFVLKPSQRVNTAQLRIEFNELDPTNVKPLSCTSKWNFTNSMDDWLLYVVHDEGYLASKGQRRNIRYCYDDLQATDTDALRQDWNAIDHRKFDALNQLANAVNNHIPFAVLVQQGAIPISQRQQYEFQYNALMRLSRNNESGRYTPHEVINDDGETIPTGFEKIETDDIDF